MDCRIVLLSQACKTLQRYLEWPTIHQQNTHYRGSSSICLVQGVKHARQLLSIDIGIACSLLLWLLLMTFILRRCHLGRWRDSRGSTLCRCRFRRHDHFGHLFQISRRLVLERLLQIRSIDRKCRVRALFRSFRNRGRDLGHFLLYLA